MVRISDISLIVNFRPIIIPCFMFTVLSLGTSLMLNAQAVNSSDLIGSTDLRETIEHFRTEDVGQSVNKFKSLMPAPIIDAAVRGSVRYSFPEGIKERQINDPDVLDKFRSLIRPILNLYDREGIYEVILFTHPTPFVMIDSGVILAVSTGTLLEAISDDEVLGFIAHEIAHEYFGHYSIHSKKLFYSVTGLGNEKVLTRKASEILSIIELQCDAFAAISLAHLGFDPAAFVRAIKRFSKKFEKDSTIHYPSEQTRLKVATGVLPHKYRSDKIEISSFKLQEVQLAIRKKLPL